MLDLDEAEAAALEETCRRAELRDGQDILELGCGWGSLSLWMAERFPASRITAVSNSSSQRRFIDAKAKDRQLENLQVITADMNEFAIDRTFDRVVSVEMFEHMRNYQLLLRRIAGWLKPDGRLFVHIFCHRRFAYSFETEGATTGWASTSSPAESCPAVTCWGFSPTTSGWRSSGCGTEAITRRRRRRGCRTSMRTDRRSCPCWR